MEFTYLTQPPKRYTFQQPKLKKFVEDWSFGKVLNLFAGKTKLDLNETRVDIDKEMIADFYMDVREFVSFAKSKGMIFDTVILDPPYTWRKAKEMYNGNMIGQYPRLKTELLEILSPQARIISLGWDTVGMSKSRGAEKIAVCVICHNGDHRDTLCVVEQLIATPSDSPSASANAEDLICVKEENQK